MPVAAIKSTAAVDQGIVLHAEHDLVPLPALRTATFLPASRRVDAAAWPFHATHIEPASSLDIPSAL
jgi:hypothetical protein